MRCDMPNNENRNKLQTSAEEYRKRYNALIAAEISELERVSARKDALTSGKPAVQTVLAEEERLKREAAIAAELFRLRTAYPVQARNFTPLEVKAVNALWSDIFIGLEPEILHEAVTRFITTDRKAFFPSPGQIAGIAAEITAEREAEREKAAYEKSIGELRKIRALTDKGEHCGTCAYCRHEKNKRRYPGNDRGEESERLFCTNPESYKYENYGGYGEAGLKLGTSRTIRCGFYKPEPCAEEERREKRE